MFNIEKCEFAPEYIKNVARFYNFNPDSYAIFIMHKDVDPVAYPIMRDRTPELSAAVMGMADKDFVQTFDYTGSELHQQFGFDAVGAQFVTKYRIIFA